MSITTTDTQTLANEPITLAQAKVQLRVTHALDDDQITRIIFMAREEAEQYSARTLRLTVVRSRTYRGWPWCMRFDHPPLIAVDAVKYFDADNAEQTLSSAAYILRTPTEGRGDLQWSTAPGTVLPLTYDRPDSVKVEYRTGYTTADAVPETAKGAILMLCNAYYDSSEFKEAEAYRSTAKRILDLTDWGNYE
ncbi:MAG: hypothetical protein E4G91_11310 [Candidatus Zixiibacteriota bacterium]|nr:MAG: hypothetical protein E4G91_11310 [candidate division Zixibacteria bacterium]